MQSAHETRNKDNMFCSWSAARLWDHTEAKWGISMPHSSLQVPSRGCLLLAAHLYKEGYIVGVATGGAGGQESFALKAKKETNEG